MLLTVFQCSDESPGRSRRTELGGSNDKERVLREWSETNFDVGRGRRRLSEQTSIIPRHVLYNMHVV